MARFFLLCFVAIGPIENVDTIGTAVAVTDAHCGTAWDEMTDVQYDGYIFTLPDCDFFGGWMKMSKSMQDFTTCYDGSHQPWSVLYVFQGHRHLAECLRGNFVHSCPCQKCAPERESFVSESLWTASAHQPSGAGSCPGGTSDVGAWINQAAVMRLNWE